MSIDTLTHQPEEIEKLFDPQDIADVREAYQQITAELEAVEPEEVRFVAIKKISDATGGVVNPATLATGVGLYYCFRGARNIDTTEGGVDVIKGKTWDLIDGFLARYFGTASPSGEAIDAAADKFTNFHIVIEGIRKGVITPGKGAFILAQNGANVALTAIARKNGRETHSSRAGKHATAGGSTQMGAAGTSFQIKSERGSTRFTEFADFVDDAAFGVSVELGLRATYGYWKDAFSDGPIEHNIMLETDELKDLFSRYLGQAHEKGFGYDGYTTKDSLGHEVILDHAAIATIARSYRADESIAHCALVQEDGSINEAHLSLDGSSLNPKLPQIYSTKAALLAGGIALGAGYIEGKHAETSPLLSRAARKVRRVAAGPAIYHATGKLIQPSVDAWRQEKLHYHESKPE